MKDMTVRIKKVIFALVAAIFAASVMSSGALAADFIRVGTPSQAEQISSSPSVLYVQTISLKINGVKALLKNRAIAVNGTTLMPLREIMELLDIRVEWVQETKTVKMSKGGTAAELAIGSDVLTVNGKASSMPAKAELIGDITYVPIRAVAESFGATVGWDNYTKTVGIYTLENKNTLRIGDYIIRIGKSVSDMIFYCGEPSYSFLGENGLTWYVYAKYRTSLMAVATDGGIIFGYYTNSPYFTTSDGVTYGTPTTRSSKEYEVQSFPDHTFAKYNDLIGGKLISVSYMTKGVGNDFDESEALKNQSRLGIDIINAFRYTNDKMAVEYDKYAADCCLDHAGYMAQKGSLTHTGADGSSAIQRYLRYNPSFKWTSWGENVCAGAANVFTCINGWINSEQHRSLLLSDKKYAGLGMVYAPNAKYRYCAALLMLKA